MIRDVEECIFNFLQNVCGSSKAQVTKFRILNMVLVITLENIQQNNKHLELFRDEMLQ